MAHERKRRNKVIFILLGVFLLIGILVYFLFFTTSHKNDDIKVQKKMEHEVLRHPAVPDSVAIVKDTAVVN